MVEVVGIEAANIWLGLHIHQRVHGHPVMIPTIYTSAVNKKHHRDTPELDDPPG